MQRIAFQLRLKPGSEAAYDEAHRHVWPELLEELAALGVREYSIFRRDTDLFLYMLVADFKGLVEALGRSEVNQRWQRTMAPLLLPIPSLRQEDAFATMQEVFYMSGSAGHRDQTSRPHG